MKIHHIDHVAINVNDLCVAKLKAKGTGIFSEV